MRNFNGKLFRSPNINVDYFREYLCDAILHDTGCVTIEPENLTQKVLDIIFNDKYKNNIFIEFDYNGQIVCQPVKLYDEGVNLEGINVEIGKSPNEKGFICFYIKTKAFANIGL